MAGALLAARPGRSAWSGVALALAVACKLAFVVPALAIVLAGADRRRTGAAFGLRRGPRRRLARGLRHGSLDGGGARPIRGRDRVAALRRRAGSPRLPGKTYRSSSSLRRSCSPPAGAPRSAPTPSSSRCCSRAPPAACSSACRCSSTVPISMSSWSQKHRCSRSRRPAPWRCLLAPSRHAPARIPRHCAAPRTVGLDRTDPANAARAPPRRPVGARQVSYPRRSALRSAPRAAARRRALTRGRRIPFLADCRMPGEQPRRSSSPTPRPIGPLRAVPRLTCRVARERSGARLLDCDQRALRAPTPLGVAAEPAAAMHARGGTGSRSAAGWSRARYQPRAPRAGSPPSRQPPCS